MSSSSFDIDSVGPEVSQDILRDEVAAYDLLVELVDLLAEQREAALRQVEPGLAAQVLSLLGVDPGSDETWMHPLLPSTEPEPLPETVGAYRILSLLGEGGMGRVYLAEQVEPVRRRVALKVLRVVGGSVEARARFEAERHAMGRLDHANVGLLLDAGETDAGLPYFAMELIEGAPITEYCDRHTLSLEQRLRLLVDVCRGVDHAHSKLLLHRDIKPSNILVAEHERPVPKLIDFGIAKGLDQRLVDATLVTGARVIGTPEYMSPEALGIGGRSAGEVDIRSDVFSLGVVLYELLTGIRPWVADGAATAAASPMARLKDRVRSSARSPSSGYADLDPAEQAEIAASRRFHPAEGARKLRGDLDHIVMKALDEDPERRYRSAAELGDDLERFLNHEPVSAQRPTAAYLLRKLIERNRPAFVGAVVAALAVLLGIAGTSIGLVKARQAESVAVAEAEKAKQARDASEDVVQFLIQSFRGTGVIYPGQASSPADRSAREILETAATIVDQQLQERPLARARIKTTLGSVYRQLGLLDLSARQLEEAVQLYRDHPGSDGQAKAQAWLDLSNARILLGDPRAAKVLLDEMSATLPEQGDADMGSIRGRLLINKARVLRDLADFNGAESAAKEAVELLRRVEIVEVLNLPVAHSTLATVYFRQQQWPEAEADFRASLRLYERILEPGHATLAQAAENVAAAIASQGRLAEATPFFERGLAEKRAVLGDDHYTVADSLNNLGRLHSDLGDPAKAEALHREALAIRKKALGPSHRRTAHSLNNLARVVAEQGRLEEAVDLQQQAVEIRRTATGGSQELESSLHHLAELYRALGRDAEAEALGRQADGLEGSEP